MSDRLKNTLSYCLKLFLFIVPFYYVVYALFWEDVPRKEMIITSLLYGGVNVMFLGSLHYFRTGRDREQAEE